MTALTIGTSEIRQLDGLYSLNDLHQAAGGEEKHAPSNFMRLDQTKALISEIQSAEMQTATKSINGGKNRGTYVCRELVYAYANWISPAFYLRMIRAFDAMQKVGAGETAAKALPGSISKELRAHINSTAHRIALKQYDTIHAILTDCVRDNMACGADEKDCFSYVDRYANLADGTVLANIRDLQELVNGIGAVIDEAARTIGAIKRIEDRSGYNLYSRPERHDFENPDFHKNDRLIREVIDRIAGTNH